MARENWMDKNPTRVVSFYGLMSFDYNQYINI